MLQRVGLDSFYKEIPNYPKMLGVISLGTLLLEAGLWSVKESPSIGLKAFLIGLCKIDHISNIILPSVFTLRTNRFLIGAVSLPVLYNHIVDVKIQKARYIVVPITRFFNTLAKIVNSFAIGKMVHESFYKGQKPGALMGVTTLLLLGLSASNVYSD